MPFRDRLKKVMSRHSVSSRSNSTSNNSSASSTTTSSSSLTKSKTTGDRSSKYINGDPHHVLYGPNEVIPYKYKRPVNKEHKAKLDAFSFAKAWREAARKGSAASVGTASGYSPMGSRMPSRRGSLLGGAGSAVGRRGAAVDNGMDGMDDSLPLSSLRDNTASDAMAMTTASGETMGKDFAASRHPDSAFDLQELDRALTRSQC